MAGLPTVTHMRKGQLGGYAPNLEISHHAKTGITEETSEKACTGQAVGEINEAHMEIMIQGEGEEIHQDQALKNQSQTEAQEGSQEEEKVIPDP